MGLRAEIRKSLARGDPGSEIVLVRFHRVRAFGRRAPNDPVIVSANFVTKGDRPSSKRRLELVQDHEPLIEVA